MWGNWTFSLSLVWGRTDAQRVIGYTLFKQEHATFIAMFFPVLSVVVIETYMAELVYDGCDRWLPAQKDLHVALVHGG